MIDISQVKDYKETFLSNLSNDELKHKMSQSYLGVLTNDTTLYNPLDKIPAVANDRIGEYICHLMSDPDYLYFLLNYILQIDSWPQQVLVLKELYTHRFPMLIGSRGFGKSFVLAVYLLVRMLLVPGTKCVITSAGFRQAKVVFDYMETIWKKSPMLQNCFKGSKNGAFHGTDVWTFRLGDSVTYAIPVGPDGSKVRGYRANCVHGDTLISTDKGLVKIKDFDKLGCNSVLNENNVLEKPDKFYKTKKTDVYEITTVNGYSIKFSKIHQIKTDKGWKLGGEITPQDKICLNVNENFPKNNFIYTSPKGEQIEIDKPQIRYLLSNISFYSRDVPDYVLMSPRDIVYEYLKAHFNGSMMLGDTFESFNLKKCQALQVLLLKFNLTSRIQKKQEDAVGAVAHKYSLTIDSQIFSKTNSFFEAVATVTKLDEQEELFDFELPETHTFIGNGIINHNCLIADEFATLNRQVFEEVMSGFLSVAASPVEQIIYNAQQNYSKKLNIQIPVSDKNSSFIQNQLVLSGTAYFKINHFYAYCTKWRDIIYSKSNPKILNDIFDNEEDKKNINQDDYAVVRMPIELTVNGYMDLAQVSRIKASTTKDVYLREYGACFSDDSDGFFKKSLIDSCTIMDETNKDLFIPCLYGDQNKKYVMGVDPAYQGDNFAIVVLELYKNERRVVHCWTTQSSDHKDRLKHKATEENQYFQFCARKIRSLLKHFPCEYIAMDPMGGGKSVIEALMDPDCLKPDEKLILEAIDPEKKTKPTDIQQGLHILKIINFTSEWLSDANYALKKDMEDKFLKFPYVDDISYIAADYYDHSLGESKSLYDTLDDCIYDIEELKNELTTIVVTESPTGRAKFDTPSIKTGINKKGRLKKDRYSALLLANWIGRQINGEFERLESPNTMNLTGFGRAAKTSGFYTGAGEISLKLNNLYNNMNLEKL